jgi:hypothetical protein
MAQNFLVPFVDFLLYSFSSVRFFKVSQGEMWIWYRSSMLNSRIQHAKKGLQTNMLIGENQHVNNSHKMT